MPKAPGFAWIFTLLAAPMASCQAWTPPETAVAEADAGTVICREVLEPPSNVLREVCLTEAGWRDRKEGQARAARDFMWDVFSRSGVRQ